jgi:hypothetical protein
LKRAGPPDETGIKYSERPDRPVDADDCCGFSSGCMGKQLNNNSGGFSSRNFLVVSKKLAEIAISRYDLFDIRAGRG